MDETMMNANGIGEAVQPQGGAIEEAAAPQAAGNEGIAAPQVVDIDKMTDDEFDEHLRKLAQGKTEEPPNAAENELEDKEGTAKPAEEHNEPFKQFMTQEEYQSEIDRIVGKRFGDLQRKNRESLDLLGEVTVEARNFYGDAADDTAVVKRLISDLTSQNAEKRGLEAEEYGRQTRDAEDARRYREAQEAEKTRQSEIDAIHKAWADGSQTVRARFAPNFDFNKAMTNEAFKKEILNGASVVEAYLIANRSAAEQKQTSTRKSIMQVAQHKGGMAGQTHPDINKMTDEEFDRYIREHSE